MDAAFVVCLIKDNVCLMCKNKAPNFQTVETKLEIRQGKIHRYDEDGRKRTKMADPAQPQLGDGSKLHPEAITAKKEVIPYLERAIHKDRKSETVVNDRRLIGTI
ncbi:hypothetical protein CDAR_377471 [Caerostris darwini]|uniref:Uncharacterized protein n=1 Tax=Caerostris darwini TaxID=1538125 RepID=A0AAV4W274_9ARAC|nr:hypothetical protein CDAR_377471 [Caerostris darwini]